MLVHIVRWRWLGQARHGSKLMLILHDKHLVRKLGICFYDGSIFSADEVNVLTLEQPVEVSFLLKAIIDLVKRWV